MTSAVGLRPNLYEILGLKPDASHADIERAFRRELNPFMPHVLGGVAAASVAFATLKDPARRRAYDLANGFAAPPAPAPAPALVKGAVGGGWANANVMRATARPMTLVAESGPAAEPVVAEPVSVAAAPVAAPLRKPIMPLRSKPLAENPRPAQVILGMDEAEDAVIDGRKGAIVLGAIGAVALAGGMFGWLAGSDAGAADAAVVSPLPKATPRELSIITPAADVVAEPAAPVRAVARPVVRPRAAPKPVAVASLALPAEAAVPASETGEAPVDALAPQPVSAAMPLPARTVARTIERIGYSCGSVTATQSAGGGVFNVTCSSGQRFRASPRNGRYRFKRV